MTLLRTTVSFPIPSERLLSPTVRFQRFLTLLPKTLFLMCPYPVSTMNLQVRGYSQQYSPSGKEAHASNHQTIFKSTTFLNSSPLLVGRHPQDIRMSRSQARFSLSPAFTDCVWRSVIPSRFQDPRTRVLLAMLKNCLYLKLFYHIKYEFIIFF